jgi:hypothetical protein
LNNDDIKLGIDNDGDEEDDQPRRIATTDGYDEVLANIAREHQERNAVKADIPEYLWEEHLLEGIETRKWDAAELTKVRRVSRWLRTKMLSWWKRNVTLSYIQWAETKYELTDVKSKVDWVLWNGEGYVWTNAESRGEYIGWWKQRLLIAHQDSVPAGDAISRAAKTSWWGWEAGSCPFHWRWPPFYQEVIRDGLKVHFQEPPTKYRRSQQDIDDAAIKLQVIKKLMKVRERGYIAPGLVELLTAFFRVAKGKDDI